MSSDRPAIVTRDLGKKYKVYATPFKRIREGLSFGKQILHKEVWALRHVDVEVGHGRALGLIGSNGAGKSTLLKILAGTTTQSEGSFTVDGRVASLLELGAGFHSEFSGRDNIFLNASVMGFSRKEIRAKLDSIIEFTELGHFIDQPVRTYSSGMIMRLGFSVATAIDPEVLIIDEILAVGDLHFQKKCIDRIFEFRDQGKTIVFCSHSLYDVRQICDEVLWIKDGTIEQRGAPLEVTADYANYERSLLHQPLQHVAGMEPSDERNPPKLESVALLDADGEAVSTVRTGQDLVMQLDYHVPDEWTRKINCGFAIWRSDNVLIAAASSAHDKVEVPQAPGGRFRARIEVPRLALLDGEFTVVGYIYDESGLHIYDHRMNEKSMTIRPEEGHVGVMSLNHSWAFEER
ncbi:MAG: ABC transporter ATP-binding protein [Planctomycetota bacterium JB042]